MTSNTELAELKKKLGARILSEANDLKRTPDALAHDLGIDPAIIQDVIKGKCDIVQINDVITKMGEIYPIDSSDLQLPVSDCTDGVRIMSAQESKDTSRIFNRKDASGKSTPFYEYRDTAMSVYGPFKPEWIKELRTVNDSDPHNPNVVYNNGHYMHQTTFFIGPVNFYYEVDGEKFCAEMNTGDSNYITPFQKHSFTSRDPSQDAIIVAVTFGGNVRRAQKEFYTFGERCEKYVLDVRNPRQGQIDLIKRHLSDNNLTAEHLADRNIDATKVLDASQTLSHSELEQIAQCFNVEIDQLMIPQYKSDDEVVVKHTANSTPYLYPSKSSARYSVDTLASTTKLPSMKGFNYTVLTDIVDDKAAFEHSLHSYVFNYGDEPVALHWSNGGEWHEATLEPNASAYVQPFTRYAFANKSENKGKVLEIRLPGAIGIETQKELSYFADTGRAIQETTCWFDE